MREWVHACVRACVSEKRERLGCRHHQDPSQSLSFRAPPSSPPPLLFSSPPLLLFSSYLRLGSFVHECGPIVRPRGLLLVEECAARDVVAVEAYARLPPRPLAALGLDTPIAAGAHLQMSDACEIRKERVEGRRGRKERKEGEEGGRGRRERKRA